MDDLIKELVDDFKKEKKKYEKKSKKINKECKIVCEANEDGSVGILHIKGNTVALLSMICTILVNMEKYGNNTATTLALIILSTLESEQEKND